MAQASPNLTQAVVLAVDVFGFPRASDDDHLKLAQAYTALKARLEGAVQRHDGRLFGPTEDGFLLAFQTADTAMTAAEEIATGPWPPVHVGVHSGMVGMTADGGLAGDAVSIARRIMRTADKGIVVVSDVVKRGVQTSSVSRRLMREPTPLTTNTPGELVAMHRLSYIPPVDPVARRKTHMRVYIAAAASFLVLGGGVAAVFGRDIVTTLVPKHDHVAVISLSAPHGARAATDFADSLTDEFDYVLKEGAFPTVSRQDAESLRGSGRDSNVRRLQVGAILDGSVSGPASNLDIKVAIEDPVHHQTLWSHEFTGSGDDLKTQVSSRVIGVLTCSASALRPGANVGGPQVLALYLKYCDLDSDAAASATARADEERILRQLTTTAPTFSYGHSKLALFLISKSEVEPANAGTLRDEALAEAGKAIRLDPSSSDGYVARARLTPPPGWDQREKDLALAITLPSAGADPYVVYAQMLPEVGRLREAATYAKKGARLSPWDPDILGFSGLRLADAGREDDSDLALTTSLQMAPTNPNVENFRFHIYEWMGRWNDDLRILADDTTRPPQLGQEEDPAASKAFVIGMNSTNTALRVAARDAELASVKHDRNHLMAAISHLSALGFNDDAFRLAAQVPPSPQTDDMSVLFTPLMDPMRRDPRFMALADKLGLLGYWKRSGKWPDFCTAGDLPYNCKAEAQKVASN